MTKLCWSESPSTRPTAQRLLRYLQGASHTWVPPLEYPIPDGRGEVTGLDFTSGGKWSLVAKAATSSLLLLVIIILCVLFLPPT